MEEYKKIRKSRLVGIADQARRLGNASGDLSLEQIEATLSGVTLESGSEESKNPSFVTSAVGVLPVVVRGTANSEFSLTFETSATGAV